MLMDHVTKREFSDFQKRFDDYCEKTDRRFEQVFLRFDRQDQMFGKLFKRFDYLEDKLDRYPKN